MSSHRADFARNERRILDAATRVLVADPAAGMADIADAAGLGRATLYRHFSSREALLEGLRGEALEATAAAIARCAAPGPGGDGAGVLLRRLIAEFVGVGDRYRLLLTSREDEAQREDQRQRFEQPLRELVERAQAGGELDPELPADWVLVALGGLLGRVLAEMADGRLEPDEATRLVVHVLFCGCGPG